MIHLNLNKKLPVKSIVPDPSVSILYKIFSNSLVEDSSKSFIPFICY